jgi:hypothetical protein
MSEMNDDLRQRIESMLALKPEVGTIVVMQRTLREVLAEVAKLECDGGKAYYLAQTEAIIEADNEGDLMDAYEEKPAPCAACIVCVAREAVKV